MTKTTGKKESETPQVKFSLADSMYVIAFLAFIGVLIYSVIT